MLPLLLGFLLYTAPTGAQARLDGITLPAVSGGRVAPLADSAKLATVLLFITTDCPVSNAYAPEIERIYRKYSPEQIDFYLVYTDPETTAKAAANHLHDYGYTLPAVLDGAHALSRAVAATITPEAAVVTRNEKIAYLGRIDNLYLTFGHARYAATTHDLRDALDATLGGRPPAVARTRAVGCFIPK